MHREDERILEEQRRKRIRERQRRRKRRRRQQILVRIGVFVCFFLLLGGITAFTKKTVAKMKQDVTAEVTVDEQKYVADSPEFSVELLTPNEYSRPQTALSQVNGIVVHYTANPGTTAEQNRSYFESLAETGETYASSHFVVGIDGEIVQCIPCNEIAYASNDRNDDTISIECCIADETGKFSDATYQSLTQLVTWLMGRYGLTTKDVIRHYDVTGKNCPKYYVEHPDAWDQFHQDLLAYIDTYGIEKKKEIN